MLPRASLCSAESLPKAPVSGVAGGQPWDVPVHGSLAAARQPNARARPRAESQGLPTAHVSPSLLRLLRHKTQPLTPL